MRYEGILIHKSDPRLGEAEPEGSLRAPGQVGEQNEILSKEIKTKINTLPGIKEIQIREVLFWLII